MLHKIIVIFSVINGCIHLSSSSKWHYQCTEGFCRKTLTTENTTSLLSFAECNLLCLNHAGVWPMPTGSISVANLTEINIQKFSFTTNQDTNISNSVEKAFHIFTSEIKSLVGCSAVLQAKNSNLASVQINFQITDQSTKDIGLGTVETYTIETSSGNIINVTIRAKTFFGARHGLETLSQLVIYDDLRGRVLFPANISVADGPVYGWRGIMLDTARNYVTPKAIKRTLKAMAASKLNTFHWHLTDTSSFPYVSKSHPELAEYGAYSPNKVYTDATVRDIIEYARVRGIRVVPELDAPAHVGEGWQSTGVTTCFDWTPWDKYCVEPPCGQFDPSREQLYDILEDLYGDMLDQFGTNVFHMGGDEINLACWKATANLTNWMVSEKGWDLEAASFLTKVWPYFQSNAAKRLHKKAGKNVPIILWSSDLTNQENVTDILPPSDYIIQVWSSGSDSSIRTLLNKNYSIILSNSDALYLDCGFAGWVTSGNNWCSPYKGWQTIYDNKPINIAVNKSNQVLGGETALWTEEAGTSSLDSRLWPRSAAFAETLWTEPATDWSEAEERMLLHRDRLVRLGIEADEIQPEWCFRNQQTCPILGKFNN
ncbi:unnamed protein product [Ceutorhynchus assimilis]|uniref:Beta-hexosaminidase n=1 Tax=Ceutorhynchus assimilis TaxID=467358 RepID=A0A9N9MQK4_9CUCU|nr:unnamed protein product [Ceutorhynchus assimilis]